jgi:hypothetical protein
MFYGKKSGNCEIELVRETLSTWKIRELYSTQFIAASGRVPKHCRYFYFVLSLRTVSRVLIRFCVYKLEFCHERFSDYQKIEDKMLRF